MAYPWLALSRVLRVLLAAILLSITFGAPPVHADTAATQTARTLSPFGMSCHVLGNFTDAQVDRELAHVAAAGASWIRLDVPWRFFEPKDGTFASHPIDQLDYICERAKKRGLRVQALIIEYPNWSNGNAGPWVPPKDDDQFEEFMTFMAERYAGRIGHWELGNEVNEREFWDVPRSTSAARYVRFLKHGYRGVKAGNPDALVISAGLAGSDDPYLQEMYDAGVKGYFDLLGVHAYTGGRSPYAKPETSQPGSSFDWLRVMKQTMERNGDHGKKIWITEVGWQTSKTESSVSLAKQAQYTYEAYERLYKEFPYVETLFVYTVRNASSNKYVRRDNYGLMYRDYTPKPAYAAFKRAQVAFQRKPTTLTAHASDLSISAGTTITISGTFAGATPGARVALQRYTVGKWKHQRYLVTGESGAYSTAVRFTSQSTYRYRVSYAGTRALRSATSKTLVISVR